MIKTKIHLPSLPITFKSVLPTTHEPVLDMYLSSPLPLHFPKSVEKGERCEREGQCWPTGARSPTSTAPFLNSYPLCHTPCWLLREAPVAQAWQHVRAPGPEGAPLTHPTPLTICPRLRSLSFTLPFIPGPPLISISPAFSLRHILVWLLSLSALPSTESPTPVLLPHQVHVGPLNPHLLPASLVTLRHSEVGLDSSLIYPTLSSSKGSPLLGSKLSSSLTYQIQESISKKYEKQSTIFTCETRSMGRSRRKSNEWRNGK